MDALGDRHRCWIQLVNCMVVFDVTQMSYQSSDRVYRAQKVSEAKFSVNRAHSVNEGKSEKSVLTELTRLTKENQRNQC